MRRLLLPGLVLLGLALVLALAPVAHLAARRLPLPPNDPTPIVAGATRPDTTAMRNLPVGLPAGVTITPAQDVYPYAVAALGVLGAREFMAVLSSSDDFALLMAARLPRLLVSVPLCTARADPRRGGASGLEAGRHPLAAALIMLAGQPGLNEPAAWKAAQLASPSCIEPVRPAAAMVSSTCCCSWRETTDDDPNPC